MAKSLAQRQAFPRTLWFRDASTLQAASSLLFLGVLSYAGFRLSSPDLPLAPGNAVLLAALLLTRPRVWWLCLCAVLPWSLLASMQAGIPAAVAPFVFAGNAIIVVIGAVGVERYAGHPRRFDGVQPVAVFVLSAAFVGPVVGATAIAFLRFIFLDDLAGAATDDLSRVSWQVTVLTNALTAVAVVPLLLLLARAPSLRIQRATVPRIVEASLLAVVAVVSALVAAGGRTGDASVPAALLYAPLIPLAWAAVRFGPYGLSMSLLLVAVVEGVVSISGQGPFIGANDTANATDLAMYLLVMSVPMLFLSAVLEDRRRERDTMRDSEARYRAVIEASTELICRYLPDGTLTFVNDAYCHYFGRSREALVGTSFLDLLPAEARSPAMQYVASIVANPRQEVYEHQVVRPDGSVGWQEWVDLVIAGADGSAIEIQGVGRDVTERHHAQEALRRSEERYRAVAGMTSDYIYEVSVKPDGRRKVRWVTDRVTEITGYSLEELQAMGTMAPFVYEEDRARYEDHISALSDGRPSKYEVRFRHKDRSIRWQQIQARPEPDPDRPGFVRWLGAAKDITDRKEAEQERNLLATQIEREHMRMDALLESIPALVWEVSTTPTGEVVRLDFISEYAETLTGYRIDEWLSRPDFWLHIVHPDDREAAERGHAAIFAAGTGTNQYRWLTKDGGTIWVEAHIRVVHNDAGEATGMRGVTLDITERRRAEETYVRQAALLELTNDAVIVRDLEGRITFWNRGAEGTYGWPRADALGQEAGKLLAPVPSRDTIDAYLEHAGIWEGELTHTRSDGRQVIVDSRQVAVRDARGAPVAILETNRDITERKRIERALRDSEERYRTMFETASAGIWEIDFSEVAVALDGIATEGRRDLRRYLHQNGAFISHLGGLLRIRDLNEAAVHMVGGRSKNEVLASFARITTPDLLRVFEEQVAMIAGGGRRRDIQTEVRIKRLDGGYVDAILAVRIPRTRDGLRSVLISTMDITERKRAERELRESEHKLQAIVDNASSVVYAKDADGRYILVNRSFEALWQVAKEDVVGRTDRELFDAAIASPFLTSDRTVWETREPLEIEESLQAHGSVRTYLSTKFPLRRADGTMYALCGISTDISERVRSRERVRAAFTELQSTIDSLTAQVAILDTRGGIVAVNEAWRRFALPDGVLISANGAGENYLGICDRATVNGDAHAGRAAAGIRSVMDGSSVDYHMVYPSHGPGGTRWFQMRVTRFQAESESRLVVAHEDVTEVKQAEESLQVLASRLLQLQDEERRRIARELHDTTAQNLFAITMNLTRLRASIANDERSHSLLSDSLALGEQALQEIRTLSYVLHPPLLDHTGLGPALQWYVDGFTRRSGIDVQLVAAGDLGRLPQETETALFRIVQESLTNIHRHSGSGTASIRLSRHRGQVVLQIRDNGTGIRQDVLAASPDEVRSLGVGIPGMRQRMRQLGGDLRIESSERGTTVTATAPIQPQRDE